MFLSYGAMYLPLIVNLGLLGGGVELFFVSAFVFPR